MKKTKGRWSNFKTAFGKIHLVDKFLIIFMIILLLQSAYNLFVYDSASAEGNSIDIIIRTSIAAIFGYFLSTNFIHHSSSPNTGSISAIGKDSLPANGTGEISNRIGFAYPGSDSDSGSDSGSDSDSDKVLVSGSTSVSSQKEDAAGENDISNRLQIIVAASIGLFCLIVLILIRNIIGTGTNLSASASSTSTVAQFRDIVSGCIGFLIGCPSSASGDGNKMP